jgi:hypothetical protein
MSDHEYVEEGARKLFSQTQLARVYGLLAVSAAFM